MTLPKSIHAALREILVAAAGVWVLAGARDKKEYVYVHNRWVEIIVRYNGEEAPPHRRADDALADSEKLRQAATAKRLEDLTSDRSADA